jgi:hypothetical protein
MLDTDVIGASGCPRPFRSRRLCARAPARERAREEGGAHARGCDNAACPWGCITSPASHRVSCSSEKETTDHGLKTRQYHREDLHSGRRLAHDRRRPQHARRQSPACPALYTRAARTGPCEAVRDSPPRQLAGRGRAACATKIAVSERCEGGREGDKNAAWPGESSRWEFCLSYTRGRRGTGCLLRYLGGVIVEISSESICARISKG